MRRLLFRLAAVLAIVAFGAACAHPQAGEGIRYGYRSVQDMLEQPLFYSAHRGGSADGPEMTMAAYRDSVRHGFGALEISLARTSDGIWFGLHDENLGRTSEVAGLPPAGEMTWAEVNRYQVTLNSGGHPQPYLAWTEFASTFGGTHVLFVDPKRESDHLGEFLDMLARDVDADHVVVKGYGDDVALADAARARGFATWGYYYTADYDSGELSRTQDHWTILGLNWDAPPAAWQATVSFGKPVMAHVIETAAQRDTARRQGARGFQVSSPDTVSPT